ncbi:PD-(D/E)XK nuclease family protein [Halobaculum sp. MBLA0147]|uniref:PD-(D/E)XK nuclease family protein n=1 Tax=Halobaculum sp. MBLA0147 TaxID=3079934 RepID=UPI00352438D0
MEDADIYGFINHLLVTSTGYHVVDYKTGPVENGVEAAANEYLPQLRAYTAALSEHDPDSDVTVSLVFTDARASWQTAFTSEELSGIRASIVDQLREEPTGNSSPE